MRLPNPDIGQTLGIIILAFNEEASLQATVNEINSLELQRSPKLLISTSLKATEGCLSTAQKLASENVNVSVYLQREPHVAAAVLEAIEELDTSLIIYMSSDGETPPNVIPSLISKQCLGDYDIVSASRWIHGGDFSGYGPTKFLMSWAAQILCKILFASALTEFTYGFRIYKKSVFQECKFLEKRHPFFLESLLVPLKLNFKIAEIPVRWKPRTEGESVVNLWTLFLYLRPIFRVRISPIRQLKKLQ